MVNIYILATGNLASPWTRNSTYDGRYVRCAGSGHGTTSGNANHTHTTTAASSGSATSTYTVYTSGVSALKNHSHSISSSSTGSSDNDPLYYTLSLWYMDASVWEATVRCFPAGAVVLSTATISYSGFSRLTACDTCLIKLGNPGSSGGRSTHTDHTVSAPLADTSSAQSVDYAAVWSVPIVVNASHNHTAEAASVSSSTIIPAYVQTRFYYTTAETDAAPQNIVCFFDGAPSANWSQQSAWNDYFPLSGNTDPSTAGADSHDHNDVAGTSTAYSSGLYGTKAYGGDTGVIVRQNHTHAFAAIPIESSSHLPLYVQLVPYKLEVDIYVRSGRPLMW